MAITPSSRRHDTTGSNPSGDQPADPRTLNPMQEPLGSMDRPGYRTSDDNDVNLRNDGTGRRAGGLGTTTSTTSRSGRGFATTFIVAAAVLVVAFLIALYLGADGRNEAMAPSTNPPVADSTPDATKDTTGSTATGGSTTTEPSDATGSTTTPPAGGTGTGQTGTGTTTAPANP